MPHDKLTKHRVLLIEDSVEIQDLLRFVFEEHGFDIDVANDGLDALGKPLDEYNVLILDLQMPNMDGKKFLHVVRRERKLDTPILMFTSHMREGLHLELIEAGANSVLPKPARGKKLVAEVLKLINELE